MTLPENYNTLIIQECTDLFMITQHINNTYILTTNTHTYTIIQQIQKTLTHTHIYNIFYILAVIVVINFIKNR